MKMFVTRKMRAVHPIGGMCAHWMPSWPRISPRIIVCTPTLHDRLGHASDRDPPVSGRDDGCLCLCGLLIAGMPLDVGAIFEGPEVSSPDHPEIGRVFRDLVVVVRGVLRAVLA